VKGVRRAKSLLELIVILSIMSIILTLSATSLTTLFRLRAQLTRDIEQGMALDRLAARWRADAHEATSASLNAGCALTLADGRTVQYSFAAPRILREVRRDAAVLHRDRFLLPVSATAVFEKEGDEPQTLVRLMIRPIEVHTRRSEMPRSATLEAAVGLHRAFAHSGGQP
jgi:hypothetical protein